MIELSKGGLVNYFDLRGESSSNNSVVVLNSKGVEVRLFLSMFNDLDGEEMVSVSKV